MIDIKKIALLLFFISLYINVYIPLEESNNKSLKKLHLYQERIEREKTFLNEKDKVLKYIQNMKKVIQKDESLLYKTNLQNSIIFNKVQTLIKKNAILYKAKVLNVIWGEPYTSSKLPYIKLPLRFIVEIEPSAIPLYLNNLFVATKALQIQQFSLIKKNNIVVLSMSFNLYKNKIGDKQ